MNCVCESWDDGCSGNKRGWGVGRREGVGRTTVGRTTVGRENLRRTNKLGNLDCNKDEKNGKSAGQGGSVEAKRSTADGAAIRWRAYNQEGGEVR